MLYFHLFHLCSFPILGFLVHKAVQLLLQNRFEESPLHILNNNSVFFFILHSIFSVIILRISFAKKDIWFISVICLFVSSLFDFKYEKKSQKMKNGRHFNLIWINLIIKIVNFHRHSFNNYVHIKKLFLERVTLKDQVCTLGQLFLFYILCKQHYYLLWLKKRIF